jgi:hypothetical protein
MAHRLAVLTPAPIDVSLRATEASASLRSVASELPPSALRDYRPIDWHCDFVSGRRWNPHLVYSSAAFAPTEGADIKVPWELSRFQHIGALARGDHEAGGVEFLLQVLDWITANPPLSGVNWTSELVVASRSMNWIWGLRLFEPVVNRFPGAMATIAASLFQHRRHLERNLAYYIERTDDHYLADVAALLYLSAAFPDMPDSDRWCLFALQELVSEMSRQVLPDGYSHMMSSHYHRFVCELFVSAASLAERIPPSRRLALTKVDSRGHPVEPRLRPAEQLPLNLEGSGVLLPASFYESLARMATVTATLSKSDGRVPQLGDNDSARAHRLLPTPAEDVRDHRGMIASVARLTGDAWLARAGASHAREGDLIAGGLSGAGMVRLQPPAADSGPVLFADAQIAVARAGPVYLVVACSPNGYGGRGGHGHNDKLSFEFALSGVDFIVDGGCPVYTADPRKRNRFRSTAAHNTISVEGREQDALPVGMKGLFQLPERSRPRLWVEPSGVITGSHVGFGTAHTRSFRLLNERMEITDVFPSAEPRFLNFNLHPAVTVGEPSVCPKGISVILERDSRIRLALDIRGVSACEVASGSYSEGYGIELPNRKLKFRIAAETVVTILRWHID